MKNRIIIIVFALMLFSCGEISIGGGSAGDNNNPDVTLNGSYAKILGVGKFLYAINTQELVTFEKVDGQLNQLDKQDVGFAIENIYHLNGLLFIGSERAMFIYKINDQGIPQKRSETEYQGMPEVTACDPVIAQGNFAYVTLRTEREGTCGRRVQINELRIYDVQNIDVPALLTVKRMTNPKGLGIKGDHLFVCDGRKGVVVLDVSQKNDPLEINRISDFEGFDLIINGNKLTVVGSSEIRQYDITDVKNIVQLGTIQL